MLMNRKIIIICFGLIVGLLGSKNTNAQCSASIVLTDTINCFGDYATIDVVTIGGGGWYVYLLEYEIFGNWYQLSTQTTYDTATFILLPANSYRVTVTDTLTGGCITQAFINITQPPDIMATFSITNPSLCFGDSIANLHLNVFGGTPPYTVTLNGGASMPITANDIDFLNVPEGVYQVVVTDANGCTKTKNQTIISPPELMGSSIISSNYNGQDISCFGGSDGVITSQVNSGGISPYEFAINGGPYSTVSIFGSLVAGSYIIYYRDSNLCEVTDTLVIQSPPPLSINSMATNILCNGNATGSINLSVNGGTTPYTYTWSNGPPTQDLNNLTAGSYSVVVRDINLCDTNLSFSITEPAALSAIINTTPVSCNGGSDGIVTIFSVTGGVAPYTYLWFDGSTGNFIDSLSAGTYSVTITDSNLCDTIIPFIITESNSFSISVNSTTSMLYNGFDVACNGDCTAGIQITPNGGTPPYLYSLNGGPYQVISNFNNLCANSYTINAVDSNVCLSSNSILLIEPSVLSVQMNSVMENCGAGDGQATATVNGGVSPYSYVWTPISQTTSTATNLSANWYSVEVQDLNICTLVDSIFVPVTNMTLTMSSTNVLCNSGSDGTASAVVSGLFVSPLTYQWCDASFQPIIGANASTVTGLTSGTYNIIVTDGSSNNCKDTNTIFVNEPMPVNLVLDSANSFFHLLCFEDSLGVASVSATGGTGFGTYSFYIDALNPQYDSTFSGLPADSYIIFVEDTNGCLDNVSVQIFEPDELLVTFSTTNIFCNGDSTGNAKAIVSGGIPPYSYVWNTGATSDSIGGLTVGTYWVEVFDANGCPIAPQADTVQIIEPLILQTFISSTPSTCGGTIWDGTASVTVLGGVPNYTYLWNTGATTNNIPASLPAGTYSVIVTDANWCMAYDTVDVLAGPQPVLSILVQNVSCFGYNDGEITPSATGGTIPYQFSIDGGNTYQNNGTVYGPYGPSAKIITVRDNEGCIAIDTVSIIEPAVLVIDSFTINEVSCYGGSDGEMTVHHSGGTPGYSYVWTNGQTGQTATGLSSGPLTVVVVDTNACPLSSGTVTMTQPDSLYIVSITSTDVLCNGGNDGSATVTTSGGVIPYSYLWSNNAITQTAFMSAGNYNVDVTDSNGCMVNASIIVNEPALLVTDSFVMDSVFCFGFSDGSATVYISGGVTPYTYLWDNGENTILADSLDAGHHVVAITDFNNCVHTDSVEVLEPATSVSIDSLIVAQIPCKDASNGSIVVLATGGTPSYTYSKDGGNTYQTAIGFIGLSPVTYNIVVKDNKGCTASVMQTITEPDSLLIASVAYHDVSCNGYNNGYIQSIAVNGGTQPYMYSVNGSVPVSHLANFNGYSPGTYTVEVFDANNCVVADIIIIAEPQALSTTITTSDYNAYEIRCNGDSTGWISVNVNGGLAPYLKTWINAQGDTVQSAYAYTTVDSLNAGLYTLVVLDANACMKTQFITLTEPTPLQHNIVTTHVTCDGWTNGSITDSVFGGVPGYSYLWDTGDTTYFIDNLPIGLYSITITDENNCQSTNSTFVNDNNKLTATISNIQDVSCFGFCDGYIEVSISGGMPFFGSNGNPIYTNIWDDPLSQITATSIGLCADDNTLSTVYTDIITDAIGCEVTITQPITQPSKLEVTASVLDEVSCYSGNDGKLKASVGLPPTGTPPHTYLWNNQQTGSIISNLVTGSYVVIATDANGCMDTTEIFLSEPSVLSVSVSSTNVSCLGDDDGTITATPAGGTPISPSGIYTYSWSDGQTTQTATGLAPGIYEVTVTDYKGCMVTSSNVLITQPLSELIVTADSTDETCVMNDGTAIANVFGGTTPYGYSWNTGQTSQTIAGLSPGNYTVDVTDYNGCVLSASTIVNAFDAIFLPSFTDYFSDTICLGDNVTISVVDNPNFAYSWSSGQWTSTITVTPTAPRTDYILTVVDVANCPNSSFDITASVWVTQLPIIPVATPNPIKVGDQVELRAASANNYSIYQWTDAENISIANTKTTLVYPEVTTTYYIMVEDANGCQGYDSIIVVVGVLVYDGISPNGDGYNDFWEIEDIARYPDADIEVYNRWGSLLFSSKGDTYNDNKWDGTHEGSPLPIGTYYYIINLNNNSDPQSGAITIIR